MGLYAAGIRHPPSLELRRTGRAAGRTLRISDCGIKNEESGDRSQNPGVNDAKTVLSFCLLSPDSSDNGQRTADHGHYLTNGLYCFSLPMVDWGDIP